MVWFLSLLFIVLVCAALFYLWRAIGYRPHKHAAIDAKKGDIPIVARPHRPEMSDVQIQVADDLRDKIHIHQTDDTHGNIDTAHHSDAKYDSKHDDAIANTNDEQDPLSSLARATESLAEQPSKTQDTPILVAGQDQAARTVLDSFEGTVQIDLLPTQGYIAGEAVLAFAREYGLKHGYMDLFHRYQHADGTGALWFSMLGAVGGGEPTRFDLAALPQSKFSSLALFVAIPNPYAEQASDAMVETALALSKNLNLQATYGSRPLTRATSSAIRAAAVC